MKQPKRIALAIERSSEYGRRFLQGVADFFDGRSDVRIELLDSAEIDEREIETCDGCICRLADDRILRKLHRQGKALVDAACFASVEGIPTIRCDYNALGALAVEHFRSHNFRNFAFCGYRHIEFSDLRRNAYVRHLESMGIRPYIYRPPFRTGKVRLTPTRQRNLIEGPIGETEDVECLTAWLKRLPKPVALFCCDDSRASAAAKACNRARIVIPDEVAILGVDNDPVYCMFGSPRLSSIDPDAERLGFAAAELLLAQITSDGKTRGCSRMIPPKGIVLRASTDIYPGAPDWFADALVYIANGIGEGISASDVFRHVGFSRTLVERAFHRILGKTVQDEIAAVRIETARRLLQTTTLPIKEIATRIGYGSVEYFTRSFAAATGDPPARFRKGHAGCEVSSSPRTDSNPAFAKRSADRSSANY